MDTLESIWKALEPHVVEALVAIITAGTPLVIAWLRARTQRLTVDQATREAEAMGYREGLQGPQKKAHAKALVNARLSAWARPGEDALDRMIERSVPQARSSVPPRD